MKEYGKKLTKNKIKIIEGYLLKLKEAINLKQMLDIDTYIEIRTKPIINLIKEIRKMLIRKYKMLIMKK
ncbi:hypothetical protein ONB75_00590 [Candidatus Karelsulcia muelleri]|uniref:hypothetical protein n=1 Tax=Candidatus Karelsulcia muelleri TaxID=336810 RepID=UPI002367DE09|nr:hypothetical protein [Candidatus Karelsulcia muelleri]WDI79499.1 hypothetical protein ONB75_00590 [Candidatus Karelsulcia muelleri]